MTILLELPVEVEAQLRQAAEKVGLGTDTYVLMTLRKHLQQMQEQPPHLSKAESDLLQQINLGLSQEEWQRYHELIAKRRAETLTLGEQDELIAFSNRIETANAIRVASLAELARLHGTSVGAVMKQLGIEIPTYV